MKPTREGEVDWARVVTLFPDLLELTPDLRTRFLDRHCAGAPALRRELEAMLEASSRAALLDCVPQVVARTDGNASVPDTLAAGTRIGAWKVVRQIGRGGMGEVYLAERAEGGFTQQAAIKLLHRDAMQHTDRFEEERRILAQLTHPNIARLLDGGFHEDRAWMAMEYISGQTITAYCRNHALPLAGRLKLFHQACAAVAHAHAAMVVHRDLKPSNILVDDAGRVKLLDFGIAKLLDPQSAAMRVTHTTAFTPDHAAPEQIEGGPITTATDTYALGVVLYEMLSGRLPWAFGDTPLSRAVDRLLREDPPPPSQAVQEGPDGAVPAHEIEGDLDAIVARCLRRLPPDRYLTVQALQDDLDRHARHLPVRAREGGRGYVARLWLRRHRMFAAAAAIACVSLLAGLGIALWQADIAREQARQARLGANRAEQVKEFVLSVFREQDPLSRRGDVARSPSQLVLEGVRQLDQRFGDDPELRAELLDDLGEIQASLGDLDGGHATLLEALQQRIRLHGIGSDQALESERKLAMVAMQRGNLEEAGERAQRVIAAADPNRHVQAVEAARAKRLLAIVLVNRKERDQAVAMAGEAVDELSAMLGPHDPETLDAMYRHAQTLTQLRRDAEAEAVLREVAAQIQSARGADSAQLIAPLIALAGVIRQAQRGDEADPIYARAVALAEHHIGPRHLQLAAALSRHGALKVQRKEYEAASALFDRAEAAMPPEEPTELAQLLTNRGRLHLAQGRLDPAERDFHRAFELRRKANGDGDGVTWFAASQWGRALAQQGKLAQAEQVQREALKRLADILGPDAYQNALLLDALAETLTQSRRHGEAVAVLERALTITAREYPPTHPVHRERAQQLRQAEQLAGGANPGISLR